jgi:membrane glycosyltransferase
MTPVILGLLLAVPLAALTASASAGRGLRRLGLLLVPEEAEMPAILKRANDLAPIIGTRLRDADAISQLVNDAELAAAHAAMIESRPRRRGDIDVELVVGIAKLDDSDSIEEARLDRKELNALLADTRGFQRLMAAAGASRLSSSSGDRR